MVKAGYKQTEAGVIPVDWEVLKLQDVMKSFQNGYGFSAKSYVSDGVPIITMAQIGLDGTFRFSEDSVNYWPVEFFKSLTTFHVYDGDVIMSMTDVTPEKNLIGRMTIVHSDRVALLNQRVGLLRLNLEKISPLFLAACSNQRRWREYSKSVASLGVQANISTKDIKNGLVVVPPIEEQRAIAEALSDMDTLIAALDKLIAKKRDIKTGTMQQLLTGKKRLPGFNGRWKSYKLGDVAFLIKGSSLSKSLLTESGQNRCILYGELFTTYERVISKVVSRTNSNLGIASISGDVLMPGSTTTTGEDLAIASALLVDDVLLGGDINVIRQRGKFYYPVFLSFYLTVVCRLSIAERTQGITIIHLYGRDLAELELNLPSVQEQDAIASIISDMDAEITALETRRAKTQAIKQGMMQELLTGRTRLNYD